MSAAVCVHDIGDGHPAAFHIVNFEVVGVAEMLEYRVVFFLIGDSYAGQFMPPFL
ncbi:hypothetical protein SDC9_178724 [bioreactor metagenome]|uniref:Uncharacterized protein n=1 Tax=bioreactor metagenome TaxID=1076179 RepID=A0A645GXY2_9ZZZZ